MTSLVKGAGSQLWYWKMAISLAVLFSINALCTAIVAGLIEKDWTTLTGTAKFVLVVTIIGNWSGTMLAFFNRTFARLSDNPQLLNENPASLLTRTTDLQLPNSNQK